ncbi:MAG: hypothetical protein ACI8VI_001564, partial [Granulosicoccus sp.]
MYYFLTILKKHKANNKPNPIEPPPPELFTFDGGTTTTTGAALTVTLRAALI